jgi:predicted lipoprotein with Yx(FWY)xxD motif
MGVSITNMARSALAVGAVALVLVGCGAAGSDAEGSPGSGVVSVAPVDGTDVLVDSEGRTLYTAEAEQGGQILCVEACTAFWEPVIVSQEQAEAATAELGAQLGVVERPEGESQLTFDGLPVYTFAEEDPGQLAGDGFVDDFRGTHFEWTAARTSGSAGSDPTDDGTGGGFDY